MRLSDNWIPLCEGDVPCNHVGMVIPVGEDRAHCINCAAWWGSLSAALSRLTKECALEEHEDTPLLQDVTCLIGALKIVMEQRDLLRNVVQGVQRGRYGDGGRHAHLVPPVLTPDEGRGDGHE